MYRARGYPSRTGAPALQQRVIRITGRYLVLDEGLNNERVRARRLPAGTLTAGGLPLRSFQSPGGAVRSYILPERVPGIFPGFKPMYLKERLGKWHRHGDSTPERHGIIEYVATRRGQGMMR